MYSLYSCIPSTRNILVVYVQCCILKIVLYCSPIQVHIVCYVGIAHYLGIVLLCSCNYYLGIVLLYSCSCYLGIVQLQGVNRKCHLHIWGPPLCHMLMNMVNMLVKRRLVWFEFLLYAKMHMASKGRVCSLIRSSDETMPQLCVKMCFRINNISDSLNPNHDSYFESEYRWSLTTHNWWLEDKSSNLCFKIYKIPHRLYRV